MALGTFRFPTNKPTQTSYLKRRWCWALLPPMATGLRTSFDGSASELHLVCLSPRLTISLLVLDSGQPLKFLAPLICCCPVDLGLAMRVRHALGSFRFVPPGRCMYTSFQLYLSVSLCVCLLRLCGISLNNKSSNDMSLNDKSLPGRWLWLVINQLICTPARVAACTSISSPTIPWTN